MEDPLAPWGRKRDGTPRAKPGRKQGAIIGNDGKVAAHSGIDRDTGEPIEAGTLVPLPLSADGEVDLDNLTAQDGIVIAKTVQVIEQAKATRQRRDILDGKLIPIDDAAQAYADMVNRAKLLFQTLPQKLGATLAHETEPGEIEKTLDEEIREVLSILSTPIEIKTGATRLTNRQEAVEGHSE